MYILTAPLDSPLLRCTVYIFKVDTVYHQSEKTRQRKINRRHRSLDGTWLGNRGRARPEGINASKDWRSSQQGPGRPKT